MAGTVLILRPQPGADRTAAKARELGLEPVVAPLFTVQPVAWRAPDPIGFDAVMLTSAHAARQAGPQLDAFLHLPCYAVGEATATAARAMGFADVIAGPSDAQALADMMAKAGVRRAVHPCGADRIDFDMSGLSLDRRIVYASEPVDELPSEAREALASGAAALVHSPRAALTFAALCDRAGFARSDIAIAAISTAAAVAAGPGWAGVASAGAMRDEALLELAVKLCNSDASRE